MIGSSIIKQFVVNLKNKIQYGLTDQECIEGIEEICSFFGIPVPVLIQNVTNDPDGCTCVINRDRSTLHDDILHYNLKELKSLGVSEKLGFMAVMTHECAHRVFQDYSFPGPDNGQWEKEMVADYFMGIKIGLSGWDVAPVINALAKAHGAGSHPVGKVREEYIRYGMFEARRHIVQRRKGTIQEYLDLFLEYRRTHYKELREAELKIY